MIPSLGLERSFHLSHWTSSTSAELHATLQVVNYIRNSPTESWCIYSDSHAALLMLQLAHAIGVPLATEGAYLVSMAISEGHRLVFHWIPGHCGIRGNEEADAAAARAHSLNERVAILFSTYDAGCLVRRFFTSQCSLRWLEGASLASQLALSDPDLKFRIPQQIQRYRKTFFLRLRLRVPYGHQFFHRINNGILPRTLPFPGQLKAPNTFS